jgi:hypothetical protein
MAIARTEEVEWRSTALGNEVLDAAISRDRNLTLRYAERLLAEHENLPKHCDSLTSHRCRVHGPVCVAAAGYGYHGFGWERKAMA